MRSSAAWNRNSQNWGRESPRFDAAQLLRWLSGQEQAWLIAHAADPCPEDWQSRSEDTLARLRGGEPLQYLLGEWEFCGLTLTVGPGVLIPRRTPKRWWTPVWNGSPPPLAR